MPTERWTRTRQVFEGALEREPGARAAYVAAACGPDAALQAEVNRLLRAHAIDDAFIEQPAAEHLGCARRETVTDWIGRRIGPYRIVAAAGRGGLSEVYRAVRDDGEYAHQAAIKVMQPGLRTDALLARFRDERKMLAALSHPNIAHFLDGGATDDGAPYLVMEFVEGEPIDVYCDRHELGLEARLDLFRTLCGAVHYVHQHLMVHGDIKGSNVLVTREGVVKLLDFGVARLLDPAAGNPGDGSESRAATLMLLTPEYASPEQLRGAPLTTASDVWSLGVLLYRLLTGTTPFGTERTSPVVVAERIAAGAPVAPSTAASKPLDAPASPSASGATGAASATRLHSKFARELRGDLDTMVLKALQRDPEDRYASAQQFADDVRRYLRGFPVEARPDSAAYRVRRFARRHSAATAASALFALALIGGIVAAGWQAHVASAERERAERHFGQVRELSAVFIDDVYDAIVQIPGSTAARKLLVDGSLKYLSALERESKDSVELRRNLGKAYERLGDVQGARLAPNLGDYDQALASYRRALEIRKALALEHPTPQHRAEHLRSAVVLAESLLDHDRLDEGGALTREAVRLADVVLADGAADRAARRYAAAAYITLGDVETNRDPAAALSALRKARAVHAGLASSDPSDLRARRDLALITARLGMVHMRGTGDWTAARGYYSEALALLDRLVIEAPRNAELTRMRLLTRGTIGMLDNYLRRPRDALRETEPLLIEIERLRAADATDATAPMLLAAGLNIVGESRLQLGEPAIALEHFARAQQLLAPLGAAVAQRDFRTIIAATYSGLARARVAAAPAGGARRAAELRRAREDAGVAMALLAAVPSNDPDRREAQMLRDATRPIVDEEALPAR